MSKGSIGIGGITFTGAITVNGPMFDIHDNRNVYINPKEADKEKSNKVVGEMEEPSAELLSAEANKIWNRLRKAGFIVVDGYGLAKGISNNQAAYIADSMARKLGIKKKWKVFEQLWGISNMAQLAGAWQQTGKLPPLASDIDDAIK